MDEVEYPSLQEDTSYGRLPDGLGDLFVLLEPSPGAPNGNTPPQGVCGNGVVEDGEVCDGESTGTCLAFGFVEGTATCDTTCEELSLAGCVPVASDVVLNEVKDEEEWLELYNRGSVAVDLTGWSVVDRQLPDPERAYALGGTLGPGQFLVLPEPPTPLGFGIDPPDPLTLRDGAGRIRDYFELESSHDCRVPDGAEWNPYGLGCLVSPGTSNVP